jgi:hypothetical protein
MTPKGFKLLAAAVLTSASIHLSAGQNPLPNPHAMSAFGPKRTFEVEVLTSALGQKPTYERIERDCDGRHGSRRRFDL